MKRALAANVRRIRKERGLTLEQAAEAGDMNWRQWQKVEAAASSFTLKTLAKLATGLDIPPGDLFG